MLTIIDYGVGNLGSIQNMLKKIGVDSLITSDIAEIEKADKLILPGVGKFDYGITQLQNKNIIPILNEKVLIKKTPILGICLGVQLFSKKSEEGELPGLAWIDADTIRFKLDEKSSLKIPNMGWHDVSIKKESKLTQNLGSNSRFYFVHSFHLKCSNTHDELMTTTYGYDYPSAIEKDNILGVQFHPEKSHKFGMQLLKNFIENY